MATKFFRTVRGDAEACCLEHIFDCRNTVWNLFCTSWIAVGWPCILFIKNIFKKIRNKEFQSDTWVSERELNGQIHESLCLIWFYFNFETMSVYMQHKLMAEDSIRVKRQFKYFRPDARKQMTALFIGNNRYWFRHRDVFPLPGTSFLSCHFPPDPRTVVKVYFTSTLRPSNCLHRFSMSS